MRFSRRFDVNILNNNDTETASAQRFLRFVFSVMLRFLSEKNVKLILLTIYEIFPFIWKIADRAKISINNYSVCNGAAQWQHWLSLYQLLSERGNVCCAEEMLLAEALHKCQSWFSKQPVSPGNLSFLSLHCVYFYIMYILYKRFLSIKVFNFNIHIVVRKANSYRIMKS